MDAEDRSDRHAPIRVAFASHDGHAAAIARHIGERLAAKGTAVAITDLATVAHAREVTDGARLVALVAAVRYGKHLPPAERFLEHYRRLTQPPPLALASVNLTARKPAKRTVETNPYLKKLIARHGLRPTATAVFAGRLDYPRYRWFDRQMIRFIMAMTGGPTDGRSRIDYTAWDDVDAFADALAASDVGV